MEQLNFKMMMAALLFMIPLFLSAEGIGSGSILKSEFVGFGSDGVNNYKTFMVVAPTTGYYHMGLWHNPAKHSDGTYARYLVDVNDVFIGYVSNQKGNWQSSNLDNATLVRLVAGNNFVSIYMPSPEVPNVESIVLSTDASDASFLSTPFDDYLEEAMQGHYDAWNEGSSKTDEVMELTDGVDKEMVISNIPLKYSFFTYYSLTAGSELNIVTSGSIGHEVDIFYFGQYVIPNGSQGNKITHSVVPASNSQAEGLNWLGVSEDSAGVSNVQKIYKTIRIPRSGYYMVKLRSKQNGVLGTVDMTINGTYSFQNCPVYYAGQSHVIPASTVRTMYTKCSMPLYNDPMLFIEGNVSDRVVGFNDDGGLTSSGQSLYDSYISRSFSVKTSAFHISNYSSSLPTSYCDVHIVFGDDTNAVLAKRNNSDLLRKETIEPQSQTHSQVSFFPESPSLTSVFTITSKSGILGIRVYDMSGRQLRTIPATGQTHMSVLLPYELGITKSGVYVFVVNSENATEVKRVIIRK